MSPNSFLSRVFVLFFEQIEGTGLSDARQQIARGASDLFTLNSFRQM